MMKPRKDPPRVQIVLKTKSLNSYGYFCSFPNPSIVASLSWCKSLKSTFAFGNHVCGSQRLLPLASALLQNNHLDTRFSNQKVVVFLEPTASVSRIPAGQHLLVDMNGVDSDFLSSEKDLIHAMKSTANATSFDFISSYCHSPTEESISCIAVLSEGHMAFHVWHEDEVISLDLFIADASKSLIPTVELANQG